MMVAVVSSTGVKLMPTTNYKARKMLNSGKATIHSYNPFCIQLTERENGDTQPIEYCCDTGYVHVGISVKSKKHEYAGFQVDTLMDEKKKHKDCAMYRRTRRNRKTRYRQARFDNRKATKPEGWLAPSIEHKKDIQLYWVKKYTDVMPITDITFEMGKFDTQLLKALANGEPALQGVDYQRGGTYDYYDMRAAVFARDGYKCVICHKGPEDGRKLQTHHVLYRTLGGTDTMDNYATVCTHCHTPKNHNKGNALWKLMETWKVPQFKGATYMTSVRWKMYEQLKEEHPDINVHITYGSTTKWNRKLLNICKTHINDAWSMGDFHPTHRNTHLLLKKKRRNDRVLTKFTDAKYMDLRDGKIKYGKELPNGRVNRNHSLDSENLSVYRAHKTSKGNFKIQKNRYPFHSGDVILYEGKRYTCGGCSNHGDRVSIKELDKTYIPSKLKLISYIGGYSRMAIS